MLACDEMTFELNFSSLSPKRRRKFFFEKEFSFFWKNFLSFGRKFFSEEENSFSMKKNLFLEKKNLFRQFSHRVSHTTYLGIKIKNQSQTPRWPCKRSIDTEVGTNVSNFILFPFLNFHFIKWRPRCRAEKKIARIGPKLTKRQYFAVKGNILESGTIRNKVCGSDKVFRRLICPFVLYM